MTIMNEPERQAAVRSLRNLAAEYRANAEHVERWRWWNVVFVFPPNKPFAAELRQSAADFEQAAREIEAGTRC